MFKNELFLCIGVDDSYSQARLCKTWYLGKPEDLSLFGVSRDGPDLWHNHLLAFDVIYMKTHISD